MRHLGQVKMERSGSKNRSSFLFHISTHSSPALHESPCSPTVLKQTNEVKGKERSERNLTYTAEEDIGKNASSA